MTADFQARIERDYPPMLRRGDVMAIGKWMGLSERAVRELIEGEEAAIKARKIGGQKRGYFDRERVIEVLRDLT